MKMVQSIILLIDCLLLEYLTYFLLPSVCSTLSIKNKACYQVKCVQILTSKSNVKFLYELRFIGKDRQG